MSTAMLVQLVGGFEKVHGGFGYGDRNQKGEEILNFAVAYDLMIANTLFRKQQSHIITFISGQHSVKLILYLLREGKNELA